MRDFGILGNHISRAGPIYQARYIKQPLVCTCARNRCLEVSCSTNAMNRPPSRTIRPGNYVRGYLDELGCLWFCRCQEKSCCPWYALSQPQTKAGLHTATSYCIPCQPECQRRLPLRCWQRSEKEMPLRFVHAACDGPIAITRGLWEGGQHHRTMSLRCKHVPLPAWRLISDRCQSTANAHPRLPVPNPLCRPAG